MERIDWKTYYKQRYVGFPQPVGVVFGEDNREKVEDAGVSPYNAILRLMLETEGTKARGTGFMIGQGLMLTAAHVMYDYKKDKPYSPGGGRRRKLISGLQVYYGSPL